MEKIKFFLIFIVFSIFLSLSSVSASVTIADGVNCDSWLNEQKSLGLVNDDVILVQSEKVPNYYPMGFCWDEVIIVGGVEKKKWVYSLTENSKGCRVEYRMGCDICGRNTGLVWGGFGEFPGDCDDNICPSVDGGCPIRCASGNEWYGLKNSKVLSNGNCEYHSGYRYFGPLEYSEQCNPCYNKKTYWQEEPEQQQEVDVSNKEIGDWEIVSIKYPKSLPAGETLKGTMRVCMKNVGTVPSQPLWRFTDLNNDDISSAGRIIEYEPGEVTCGSPNMVTRDSRVYWQLMGDIDREIQVCTGVYFQYKESIVTDCETITIKSEGTIAQITEEIVSNDEGIEEDIETAEQEEKEIINELPKDTGSVNQIESKGFSFSRIWNSIVVFFRNLFS